MLQDAVHASLLTSLTTVDEVLDNHASEQEHDLIPYRNYVYRVCESVRCDPARQPRRAREDNCRGRLP